MASSGIEGPGILAFDTEQNDFGNIAKVKAHAATVRSAVFANLVPNEIRFILEAPRRHDRKPVWQQRVGHPQIEMRSRSCDISNRKFADLIEFHRRVARQSRVFRCNFSGAVQKLPRRIRKDRCELLFPSNPEEVVICRFCDRQFASKSVLVADDSSQDNYG